MERQGRRAPTLAEQYCLVGLLFLVATVMTVLIALGVRVADHRGSTGALILSNLLGLGLGTPVGLSAARFNWKTTAGALEHAVPVQASMRSSHVQWDPLARALAIMVLSVAASDVSAHVLHLDASSLAWVGWLTIPFAAITVWQLDISRRIRTVEGRRRARYYLMGPGIVGVVSTIEPDGQCGEIDLERVP